jgi:hypothetical protein
VASGEWRVASGEWRVASGEWRVASGKRRGIRHFADFVRNDVVFFDAKSLELWDLADMGRGSAAALRGNGGRFFLVDGILHRVR